MIDQNTFYKKIGKRIKIARNEAGLTLEDLNDLSDLDLSKGSFSAIENGKQKIYVYQLYRISKALNTPIDTFIGNSEEKIDISEEDIKKINSQ
ncbi:anaerobic benzoate catabolism transcriptional regulator [bacterium BMS3Abin15]|nr:anaerobic benzoate catabolism transcriptional regulator [bacterium BMS3Abin15]